ncbi:MAG: hypothetical protein AB7S92_11940 [Parvibaculaceae bacterium]
MPRTAIRSLLISGALAGFVATPSLAADIELPPDDSLLFSGLLGLSIGIQDASAAKGEPDVNGGTELTFAGHGHVSIPFGDSFSAQLDGQGEFYDRSGDDDARNAYVAGAHLSWRDPQAGLFGVFGGAGSADDGEADSDGDDISFLAGVEGQLYLDQLTLYVQGGWADFQMDDDDEGFTDAWFARGVARYFFTEDVLVQAEVAYGETAQYVDGDSKGEVWNWGILAKTRLSDSVPLYGTLEYRGGHYEETEDDAEAVEEHAFLIGVDFAFGAQTLWENDRRGATLDTPMLPARAASWTGSVD